MPSQRNTASLEETNQKVEKSAAMFFVDYTGLTHKQLEEARMSLAEAQAEMAVVKNTLMNIALQAKKIDAKDKLTGQNATLFSYEDPMKTAKVLTAFIKKYGLPKISFGIFEGELIDEAMITKLATLPSREVLVAKLLGSLNSPISGLVYVLNGNIQKLAMILKEIEKKKAGSPASAAAVGASAEETTAPVEGTPAPEPTVTPASEAEAVSPAPEEEVEPVVETSEAAVENTETKESDPEKTE